MCLNSFPKFKNLLALVLLGSLPAFHPGASQAAQVDLGLTLGRLQNTNSVALSGMAVRLGTFSGYSDAAGLSFFANKDYSQLFSSFTSFATIGTNAPTTTDSLGQYYATFDTGSTAVNTRLFAWFVQNSSFLDPIPGSDKGWAIVSGGATGPNAGIYNPQWIAVAPDDPTKNTIEVGTIYSRIFASSSPDIVALLSTSAFGDAEGASLVIPEPSSMSLVIMGLASALAFRRKRVLLTKEDSK